MLHELTFISSLHRVKLDFFFHFSDLPFPFSSFICSFQRPRIRAASSSGATPASFSFASAGRASRSSSRRRTFTMEAIRTIKCSKSIHVQYWAAPQLLSLHCLFYQVITQQRCNFIRNPQASKREAMNSSAASQTRKERSSVRWAVMSPSRCVLHVRTSWWCPIRTECVWYHNQW